MQKTPPISTFNGRIRNFELTLSRLLIIAACGHVALTVMVYLCGRYGVVPQAYVDGNGISFLFAADCKGFRMEAVSLIDVLRNKGIIEWMNASSDYLINPFHVKLYSLSFAALGPVFGYNILSAEPINLSYYLLVIYFIFAVGREAFNERTGLLAASIVALWPSFLLHTTQLFRDPLFICLVLALVLVGAVFLTRDCATRKGLTLAVLGAAAAYVLWFIRREMWEVLFGFVLICAVLLTIRQVCEKRFLPGNVAGVLLLLLLVVSVPSIGKAHENALQGLAQATVETAQFQSTGSDANVGESIEAGNNIEASSEYGSHLLMRIARLRSNFAEGYPGASSNIDVNVELTTARGFFLYLPRALMIGCFSPFPNLWVVAGAQVGLQGRLISGMETLCMYVVVALAIFGVWSNRRRAAAWLLLLCAAESLTALGLVVVNIGTLYRMRYAFWMLLIILGAEGASQIIRMASAKQKFSDP